MRVLLPQSSIQFIADKDVGWIHEPYSTIRAIGPEFSNTFKVNRIGYIDVEHLQDKTEGTYRILVLGDSFVEAEQVPFDESFVQQLRVILRNKTGEKIEIISTGASGYGTDNEYLVAQKYVPIYKPDLVVLLFTPGNDIKDNYFERGKNQIVFGLARDGTLKIAENHVAPDPAWKRFIGKHSQLAYLMYFKVIPGVQRAFSQSNELDTEYYREFGVFQKKYTDEWNDAWTLTKTLVLETRNVAKAQGSDFVLVVGTNKFQLNQELYDKAKEKYPQFDEEHVDLEKPENILSELCQQNDMNCLDLLPEFKTYVETTGQLPHYYIDGHWNVEGHTLAAETISQYLIQKKFLPITT